ncbi:MFS transporter [Reyranella sp. CPCC 100927]|uniref:MFS transporter n=1 Tax=Reyranella sp. CPCC 100927 TaxID=2599616 RepID=UPI0015B657E5|nr:MFS transporter [Reyranella sp. CPCC 100927]
MNAMDVRVGTASVRSADRRWAGLAVLLTGAFIAVMNAIIVNVALPSVRDDLGASFTELTAVVAYYSLAYAMVLITGGRLGDLQGRRRVFVWGLGAFTVASGLCALAPTPEILIGTRILQGIAAAVMYPQVMSLIRVTFVDPWERATAFAALGIALGLSAIVGQFLGGLLVDINPWGLAWRSVFLINVPVGLVAMVAATKLVAESRSSTARRFDVLGVGLSAVGLGLLLYALINGRAAGWPAWTFVMLAIAAAVLALFVMHQRARSTAGSSGTALVDTALLTNRTFAVGIVMALVVHATIVAFPFLLVFLFQLGLSHSAFETGVIMVPHAIIFMIASLAVSRLIAWFGRTAVLANGALLTAMGFAAAAITLSVVDTPSGWHVIPALMVVGAGQGLVLTPMLNAIMSGVPEDLAGSASGLTSTMQQVGGAFGVAMINLLYFGALQASSVGAQAAHVAAFQVGAGGAVAAALITLVLALLLPRPAGQA